MLCYAILCYIIPLISFFFSAQSVLLSWDEKGRRACDTCIRPVLEVTFECPVTGEIDKAPEDLVADYSGRKRVDKWVEELTAEVCVKLVLLLTLLAVSPRNLPTFDPTDAARDAAMYWRCLAVCLRGGVCRELPSARPTRSLGWSSAAGRRERAPGELSRPCGRKRRVGRSW